MKRSRTHEGPDFENSEWDRDEIFMEECRGEEHDEHTSRLKYEYVCYDISEQVHFMAKCWI